MSKSLTPRPNLWPCGYSWPACPEIHKFASLIKLQSGLVKFINVLAFLVPVTWRLENLLAFAPSAPLKAASSRNSSAQQELKRRTHKVCIFPTIGSLERFVSAVLVEIDGKRENRTADYGKVKFQNIWLLNPFLSVNLFGGGVLK